jgi:hypothetical protein
MKMTIDLESVNGYEDESIAETMRGIIKDEVHAFVRKQVKDMMKSKEAEVKKMVAEIADRDWRKLAVMLSKMEP